MPTARSSLSRDALRAAITQWTPGIKPRWTISEVRTALRLHAAGDFSQSALLVDAMGEDDLLPGVLEKRVDAVLGSDFELRAVDEPNRQLSQRLAERYCDDWWTWFPESELGELLRWRVMLGVAIGVLDWVRGPNIWEAHLRVLHPQFLRYDQQHHKWVYLAKEGQLDVTPGNGQWILLTDGSRGYMRGAVRSLAIPWISKQLTIRDWNRYSERHGLPIIKAFAPAIADDEDQDRFWDDLKSIQSETVAQLPTDLDDNGAQFDLELLEAKDGSWQSFKDLLDRCDRRITVTLLGSNLSTEVATMGSLAATKVHRGVELAKASADAQKLSTDLREQGLFPIAALNLASVSLEVMPWPHWDTDPPEDDLGNAQAALAFGQALVQIVKAGYDVDNIDEVAERYGLKLTKRPELTVVAPVADPNSDNPAGQDQVAAE